MNSDLKASLYELNITGAKVSLETGKNVAQYGRISSLILK